MPPGGPVGMRGPNRFLTEEEKKNRPQITKALLKRIFSYLLPYWPKLLLVLAAIILSSIFGLLPSILTGKIIDEGLIGGDFGVLLVLIALSFAVLVLSNLIGVLESYLNTWVAQHITYDMRNQMYAHLQKMSHRFFTSSRQGDVITRMTSDISGVQSVIANTLTSILSNIAVLATSVVAMYQKNWILATVGVIIVPLFVLPTKRVGKTRWSLALKSQEKNDEINQILNETLSVSGQMLVKLFTNEKMEYEKYQKANREMTRLNIRESMAGRWFRVAMNTFTSMGPMLIYLVGGFLMIQMGNTSLTVGDITVMVSLLSRMYQPVNSLLNIQVDVIRSMALFTRIFEYFDMPVEVENRPYAVAPPSVKGDLGFCHVGFYYDSGQPVLQDLNFRIEAGHSVAIVGPSGAGKSTMIHLIPRLYDVTEGRITLDGRDIRGIDLEVLRKNIGVVTQDTYLFNGTIRENLLYANAQATQEQIVEACRQANIHDFIAGLPQGYDTLVGNRGIKLSGGEKQRTAVARALINNPELILADEPTGNLDSKSAQAVIDAFLRAKNELSATIFMVTHDSFAASFCDRVVILKDGNVRKTLVRGNQERRTFQDALLDAIRELSEVKGE